MEGRCGFHNVLPTPVSVDVKERLVVNRYSDSSWWWLSTADIHPEEEHFELSELPEEDMSTATNDTDTNKTANYTAGHEFYTFLPDPYFHVFWFQRLCLSYNPPQLPPPTKRVHERYERLPVVSEASKRRRKLQIKNANQSQSLQVDVEYNMERQVKEIQAKMDELKAQLDKFGPTLTESEVKIPTWVSGPFGDV